MTTFDPSRVATLVFDVGGVFAYPRFEPVRAQLSEWGGEPLPDETFLRAHHAGVLALTLAQRDRGVSRFSEDYWYFYDHAYGAQVGVDEDRRAALRPSIRTAWDWIHADNVAAFARLVAGGHRAAVVSNNDGTTVEQMRRFGVCQIGPGPLPEVAAIVDSTVVGIAKPDPAIFTPALEALGVEPEQALYVGDTVYADVDGALAAGMQVVQVDPYDDHADFSHSRVRDLTTLETQLGSARSAG